jgi:Tol biopolymer transport system component
VRVLAPVLCAALLAAAAVGGCGGDGSGRDAGADDAARRDAAASTPGQGAAPGGAGTGDASHRRPVVHQALPGETHLANIRQLTFEGENAEAYFSFDGTQLIFQSTRGEHGCDQIYMMGVDGSDLRRVSNGLGRTTCAYFLADDERILYASTHADAAACPPPPDHSRGYVWPIYASYEIYSARPDGSDLHALTNAPGYDAEATVGPDGTIVFTSVRDGDLELYSMAPDGSNVKRLTHEVGYDGGAFFSPDGTKIVYRAHHPTDPEAIADYQALLAQNLIRPGELEVFVMNADGSDKRQVTDAGGASFCPFFHPSGEKIIFASNLHDPEGRDFELYMVGIDGTGLERITHNATFDGFPMFSPDGRQLVFCSNRATPAGSRDTHVFVADWIESP